MAGPAEIAQGPIFIGTVIGLLLYGILIIQVFLYYSTYKCDQSWIKAYVFTVFIADTVSTVFLLDYAYDSLVVHFGDVARATSATWVFGMGAALAGLISSLVQLFFAWRVWVLTSNIWALTIIVGFSLANFIGAIWSAVETTVVAVFIDFQRFEAIVTVWLAAAASADIVIAVVLVWHLRKQRTGTCATDDLINRVIKVTIQTGLMTAIWAIINLILYLAMPQGYHLIFNLPLPKLYTNSLMSSLNSRLSQKSAARGDDLNTTSTIVFDRRPELIKFGSESSPAEVFVHVESHEMVEVSEDSKSNYGRKTSRSRNSPLTIPPIAEN